MNYSVTKLKNQNWSVWGIKLDNGSNAIYWSKKENVKVNEVIIIMDNKMPIELRDNQMCISFNNIKNSLDRENIIRAFCIEMRKVGVNYNSILFRFIVNNKQEEEEMKLIASRLGISSEVVRSNDYKMEDEKEKEIQEEIKDVYGSRSVMGADSKKYTEVGDTLIANYGILSNEEELQRLFQEYMKENPDIRAAYQSGQIKDEEIIRVLEEKFIKKNNRRQYELRGQHEMMKDSENVQSQVVESELERNGGIGNQELGIMRDEDDANRYQSVSDNGEIKDTLVNSDTYSGNSNKYQEEREQKEEIVRNTTYYLIDDVYGLAIYDENEKKIGNVNDGVYTVDGVNNYVLKNGEIIGCAEDWHDISQNKKDNKSLVKTYKPQEKSAAFVSLPIIIFILSFILLSVSGVLLILAK